MKITFTASEIRNIKTLNDMPEETANYMREQRKVYGESMKRNNAWEFCLVNEDNTRYLQATRTNGWDGIRSANVWHVTYGQIGWMFERDLMGEYTPTWGKRTFSKSANGTQIESHLRTKAEVIDLAKKIGIFNID